MRRLITTLRLESGIFTVLSSYSQLHTCPDNIAYQPKAQRLLRICLPKPKDKLDPLSFFPGFRQSLYYIAHSFQ